MDGAGDWRTVADGAGDGENCNGWCMRWGNCSG